SLPEDDASSSELGASRPHLGARFPQVRTRFLLAMKKINDRLMKKINVRLMNINVQSQLAKIA
uniref:hypothetical protein n=1 Tax=Alloprevotella sp. TaxID=1872471 RepID=UPI003FED6D6D